MTNKSFNLTMTAIVIVSLIASFFLTGFSSKLSDSALDESNSEEAAIVGTWTNETVTDGLSITFDKKGRGDEAATFEILNTPAGTYTLSDGNLTLQYEDNDLWGGKTVVYAYSFSDDKTELTMTETTTGNTTVYVKQEEES